MAEAARDSTEEDVVKLMDEDTWRVIREKGNIYEIHHNPRGRAMIINNYMFHRLGDLLGYERDADRLEDLFQQLHFHVIIHENLTQREMLKEFRKESANKDECDAFILCILSHGNEDNVLGVDSKPVPYDEIRAIFSTSEALKGKPKIFIIQAPRCSAFVLDQPGHDGFTPPATLQDEYFAFSTCEGGQSWVHNREGSWFIQDLIDVFCKYACQDELHKLFQKVRQQTKQREYLRGDTKLDQLTECTTSLDKDFYFFPGIAYPFSKALESTPPL